MVLYYSVQVNLFSLCLSPLIAKLSRKRISGTLSPIPHKELTVKHYLIPNLDKPQ